MMFHVLNRGGARMQVFEKAGDYQAFGRVLQETLEEAPMRIRAYCLMPNHWHLGEENDVKKGSSGSTMRGGSKMADMLILYGVASNNLQQRDQHVHELTLLTLRKTGLLGSGWVRSVYGRSLSVHETVGEGG
jgi:REP element-mobilizing transposase RayT